MPWQEDESSESSSRPADRGLCTPQDGLGWTPLMMAASRSDAEDIVELLLRRGAEVNMKSTPRAPLFTLLRVLSVLVSGPRTQRSALRRTERRALRDAPCCA